ncbi:hypothetical protein COL5a_003998 [Colletotrichum fioriniae]|uniref:uncharacterized protein n=1 Tax=Colletotrichum fioriniae TaxID=710243 RepID=UPI0023010557|nr:uncharacterized protein COL516b_000074 [Colletotrichum fioriniae]KAJ0313147.1 hypothetical protein COL516b_000074 [Colletotrichum fioriniae]KAJ0329440.1 hypothetical protein COL5a_003998 [Colletotrichum fioriniae]KAJ3948523.1 hypothetical protein N0V96_002778 [Colletotrichum fioriniae]
MADIAFATPSPLAKLSFTPIIKDDLKPATPAKSEIFNPDKHLAFVNDPKKLSLKDISLPEDIGISPVACSEPFPLFTEEAIQHMRQEIFTTEVWENCLHSTRFAPCQLRGHCPKYAPFMNQAWNDSKTLAVISQVAGVDLIPNIQYEVGNINISVQSKSSDQEKAQAKAGDNTSVTKWHYDAFPFVCVVMMSDATNMVGGETAIKTGTGEILKVRGPQMGSAVILQGRYVEHQALAAIGGAERITMITSFRPRNPCIKDDSVLTSIRPISEHSELYYQWAKYRVEVVQERLHAFLKTLEEDHVGEKPTDVRKIKEFLAQQQDYIGITDKEIVETRGPHLHWEGS